MVLFGVLFSLTVWGCDIAMFRNWDTDWIIQIVLCNVFGIKILLDIHRFHNKQLFEIFPVKVFLGNKWRSFWNNSKIWQEPSHFYKLQKINCNFSYEITKYAPIDPRSKHTNYLILTHWNMTFRLLTMPESLSTDENLKLDLL